MIGITEISSIVAASGVLVAAVYYIISLRHNAKARDGDMPIGSLGLRF